MIELLLHIAKNAGVKLGIYSYMRGLRDTLHPAYRRDHTDNKNLRLLLTFALEEDSNCIDIGAHRGAILAEMVRAAPLGKHIAYEPLPFMYKYLVGHFPSIDVRQVAVSNVEGETSFAYVKQLPGFSGFRETSNSMRLQIEKIKVQTETLDDSLPAGYVPDLIKIDVEGAERLVIEGAIKTISKYKPIIVFEHGKGASDHYGTQPCHIYELLHNRAGLCIFDLDGNGPYTLDQFEETYAQNKRWNFVARR